MTYRTNKPITSHAFNRTPGGQPVGDAWTLPQGARVHIVKGFHGGTRDAFVASDVATLKRLSGNSFDPTYRYMMINPDDVEGDSEAERGEVERLAVEHRLCARAAV